MEASALPAPASVARLSLSTPLLRLRSDEQLLALFRAGNEDAFTTIHDRYRQRLFAYTRQMLGGARQDAEDALQDVFVRAYNGLRAHDRPVSLKAWLYRVAHNRCIDHLRRPLPAPTDLLDTSRSPLHDPMELADRREDLRRLVADVQRLPRQQRSALLMRELQGMSYAELAEALDVTVPAIKSLLVRARIGLVECSEARDTACADIREDLGIAHDRGVRITGVARRHLRDCSGCREYRTGLRATSRSFAALLPVGPLGMLAHVLGIGGGSAGASAAGSAGGAGAASVGGGAASVGGGAASVGGGALTLTSAKVAVVVAVATAGGVAEVRQLAPARAPSPAAAAAAPAAARTPAAAPGGALPGAAAQARRDAAARPGSPASGRSDDGAARAPDGAAESSPATTDEASTGGVAAPAEPTTVSGAEPAAPTSTSTPAAADPTSSAPAGDAPAASSTPAGDAAPTSSAGAGRPPSP
jgi:RNA polymerase sigma factor (sigma-70 family)